MCSALQPCLGVLVPGMHAGDRACLTLCTLMLSSVGPVRIFTVKGSSASAVIRSTSLPSLPGFLSWTAPRPRREASAGGVAGGQYAGINHGRTLREVDQQLRE